MGDEAAFDEAAFDSWLASDPEHRMAFDTMWRRIMGPEMDTALHAYGRRSAATRRAVLAGGAAVLFLAVGGYQAMPLIELQLARPELYVAADGNIREVRLADGTQLVLAGGTEVTVRYTRHDRVIDLARGTLFANVIHDTRRAFRINTGNARIVDLGTSFEVSSRPGAIRVAVASGSVRFGAKGWFDTPIELAPRQAALLDDAGLKRIADVDPAGIARWRGEWAEYKGAPLQAVIADLQTFSALPIEIADPRLRDRPVSGRIRLTQPMEQLENLAIVHDFRVRRTGDAVTLSKN